MNCRGCGTELAPDPSLDAVNQAVNEVLQKSIEDAVQTGGTCPLCGHFQYVPVSHRKSVQFVLLAGSVLLLSLVLAATLLLPLAGALLTGAGDAASHHYQCRG